MSSADPSSTIRKRFTPKSGRVKTWTEKDSDGNENDFARVPVSSTSQDRDGDEFTESGLKDLKSQYDSGTVPLFLDHGSSEMGSPRYPTEGILGKWVGAEREGDVLYATARRNAANEDSEWLWNYLEEDMPVGFSVGFRALDYDGSFEEGYKFNETDLAETSAVGIPSNPDGVAGMSAEGTDWRTELDELSGADADDEPGEGTEDKMSGDDTSDETNAELLQRVLDQQDDQITELEEQVKTLTEAIDAKEDDSDDDVDDEEEEEEEEGEEGDDSDDDDEKSLTLTAGDDADEETLKQIEELRKAANDDGEVTLADSKTTLFGDEENVIEDEKGGEQADTTTGSVDWGI